MGSGIGAVVEIQALGLAALVQGRAEGRHHVLGVVAVEELGMRDHPGRIVDERDQEGFLPVTVSLLDRRAVWNRISRKT